MGTFLRQSKKQSQVVVFTSMQRGLIRALGGFSSCSLSL
jgi:hypothetical protein